MHPPINVHINFHIKQKHITLQDINVKGLPKNVTTIAFIISYHKKSSIIISYKNQAFPKLLI